MDTDTHLKTNGFTKFKSSGCFDGTNFYRNPETNECVCVDFDKVFKISLEDYLEEEEDEKDVM